MAKTQASRLNEHKSPDFSKYFSILAGKRKIPLNNLTKVFHTGKGGEQNGSN
jgi:hypothetical protein